MEKTLSLSETKMKLNSLVEDVADRDDEIIITKSGLPVAVLVPLHVHEGWKETLEIMGNKPFYKDVRRGLASLKRGGKRVPLSAVFSPKRA